MNRVTLITAALVVVSHTSVFVAAVGTKVDPGRRGTADQPLVIATVNLASQEVPRPIKIPTQSTVGSPSQVAEQVPAPNSSSKSGQGLVPPQVVADTGPAYPAAARRRHEAGVVVIEVSVDPAGTASEVRLVTSSGSVLLDHSAIDHYRAVARYQAAMINHQPIESKLIIPVRFELN